MYLLILLKKLNNIVMNNDKKYCEDCIYFLSNNDGSAKCDNFAFKNLKHLIIKNKDTACNFFEEKLKK